MGSLEILNTGEGDVKISFDTANPAEAIRAKRIITDMLRRGYALLVELPDGKYTRALSFDENTGEYLIADYDPTATAPPEIGSDDERATCPTSDTGNRKTLEDGTVIELRDGKVYRTAPGADAPELIDGRSADGQRYKELLTGKKRPRGGRRRVAMTGVRTTAIAPSAGG